MTSYLWPGDTGWPAAEEDDGLDVEDPHGDIDIDAVSLHAAGAHAFDCLTALERQVLSRHYGLGGPERSVAELHDELHVPTEHVRHTLTSALWKLRSHLAG